jgi:hypothetical protein
VKVFRQRQIRPGPIRVGALLPIVIFLLVFRILLDSDIHHLPPAHWQTLHGVMVNNSATDATLRAGILLQVAVGTGGTELW